MNETENESFQNENSQNFQAIKKAKIFQDLQDEKNIELMISQAFDIKNLIKQEMEKKKEEEAEIKKN
jgi:hypothetical protein